MDIKDIIEDLESRQSKWKQKRTDKGISFVAMSEKLGLSQSHYHKDEKYGLLINLLVKSLKRFDAIEKILDK